MDKKLLVSLMMTAPVAAFGAQSNWTSPSNGQLAYSVLPEGNPENWSPDALVDLTVKDGALVCPVSVSKLTHNAILPVGTWAWNCQSLSNAIIFINGKPQVERNAAGKAIDKDGKVVADESQLAKLLPLTSFETEYGATTNNLNIEIKPVSRDVVFSVGALTMTLDFDFATAKSNLQAALDVVTETIKSIEAYEGKENTRDEAKKLNVKKGELQAEAARIQADINAIVLDNGEELWAAYTKYALNKWKYTPKADDITVEINSFATTVKNYNADVVNENNIWKNININTAALATLNNEVAKLQTELNNKKAEIDGSTPVIDGTDLDADQIKALKDYCKASTAAEIVAAQKAIDDYKAEIAKAYSKLEDGEDGQGIQFESQYTPISTQISNITYAEAINRWKNYQAFLAGVKSVATKYGELFPLINNVYKKYNVEDPTVYDDVIGEKLVALAKIYDNNEHYSLNPGGTTADIDAATNDVYAEAKKDIETRLNDMQALYDELCDLVEDQENQLKLADQEIADLQKKYDAQLALTDNPAYDKLEQDHKDMIEADLKAWDEAIKELEAEKDAEYKNHKLNVEEAPYTDKVADVDAAEQKFKDDADEYNLTNVLAFISDLEAAKKYVDTETAAAKIKKYNLAKKFTETFENIQIAIDQYYAAGKEATDEAKTDIENAIGAKATDTEAATGVYASCDKLVDAFVYAVDQIAKAQTELGKFNTAINDKTVVINGIPSPAYGSLKDGKVNPESLKALYTYEDGDVSFTYADAETAIKKYDTDLTAIANGTEAYGNPFDAYQGALSVQTAIKNDAYSTNLPKAVTDFENTVSQKNLDALTGLVNDITTTVTTSKYAGVPGMPKADEITPVFDKNYKGYKTVKEAQDAFDAAKDDAAKLAACDTNIQLLIDAYQAIYKKIDDAKKNHDAYERLVAAVGLVQDKIDNIQLKTVQPALAHYEEEVAKLQAELDALLDGESGEIWDSYQDVTEVADEPDYNNRLNAKFTGLSDQIKALEDACAANQKYYDKQKDKSKEVANRANELIETLKEIDEVPDNLQKYLDQIDEVKEALANIDVDLTKSFAVGKSESQDPTYEARFEELLKQLNDIEGDENSTYKGAVIESNDAYLESQGLVSGDLDDKYSKAIDQVNEYRYDIKNPGYYNALMTDATFVKNHQRLQDQYIEIATLESKLKDFRNALTASVNRADYIVLDDNDVTVTVKIDEKEVEINLQALVDKAAEISKEIDDALFEVNKAATEVAKNYYNGWTDEKGDYHDGLLETAEGYYNDILTRLINAGLSEYDMDEDGNPVPGEALKAVSAESALLVGAKGSYATLYGAVNENTGAGEPAFIMGMSGICDKLDAIIKAMKDTNAFVYDAVNNQWKSEYADAEKTLSGYQEELKKYTLADTPEANNTAIAEAIQNAADLNDSWNELTNAERETQHPQYDEDLQKILDDAETLVNNAKAQHELEENNNAARTELNGDASDLEKEIKTLLEWSGYRPVQLVVIDGLQNDLDEIVSDFTNDANVNDNLQDYKDRLDDLAGDIENAYETVFGQEMSFANDLMVKARSAFNNAKLNGASESVLNDYDEKIKTVRGELDDLVAFDYEDRVDLMAALRAIEDTLADYIEYLEDLGKNSQVNTDTLDEAVAALGKQYTELNGKLTALQNDITTRGAANGTYGEEAAQTYGPDVEKLIADLSEIHNEYEADANVVPDADRYSYEMDQIADKYADVLDEWNGAIETAEKKFESDNAYYSLLDQLSELETMLVQAGDQAFHYEQLFKDTWPGYNTYSTFLADYNHLVVLINGQKADPQLGIPAIKGERETLLESKRNFSLTKDSKLPDNIVNGVFNYVHNVLPSVAAEVQDWVENEIKSDRRAVENPGNSNGYRIYFHEVQTIIDNLNAQLDKAKAVAIESISQKVVNDKPVVTTNEEAFNNYETVIEELQAIREASAEILAKAQEEKYIKGDLDKDGDITILDVQKLISIVLDENQASSLEGKDKETADVNSDNEVNVADVTTLINLMMSENNAAPQMRIRNFFGASNGNNSVRVEEVVGENGLRRYAMFLSNEVLFAAGQFDIVLPDYAKVAGVTLGERANGLDVYTNDNGASTRVLFTSLDNSLIEGNSGCVLFIDVEGNAEVKVENVIFSDQNGNAYKIGDSTTGVNGIYETVKDGVKSIYNAAGQKLKNLTKGINIVRNSDGTVTKKMGK